MNLFNCSNKLKELSIINYQLKKGAPEESRARSYQQA